MPVVRNVESVSFSERVFLQGVKCRNYLTPECTDSAAGVNDVALKTQYFRVFMQQYYILDDLAKYRK